MHTLTITFDADSVEAGVADRVFQLALKDIHPTAATKIFRYGFQRFVNDACGGKDRTDADKHALALKQLDKAKSGEFRVSTAITDEVRIGRRLAAAAFVKKHGEDAWKALDATAQLAKQDEILAKNKDHFARLVGDEIARLKAAAEEKARIAAAMGDLDI